MKTLSIDIETYSDVPLQKTGVYRYVESPNFEILLFAYSVDSQPVQVIDLACGEQIPKEILLALEDETVIKWAFNATFERICLSRFLSDWRISGTGKLALLHDMGRHDGTPTLLGRCRRCSGSGKAEALRRKRPHQILLPALCSHENQWAAYKESPLPCSEQMGHVQKI